MHEPDTDLHTWCLHVAAILVVITAGVGVILIEYDKQQDDDFICVTCFLGKFLFFKHLCRLIVHSHMHVHGQQYDRTAHHSSLQQLANPVNHTIICVNTV